MELLLSVIFLIGVCNGYPTQHYPYGYYQNYGYGSYIPPTITPAAPQQWMTTSKINTYELFLGKNGEHSVQLVFPDSDGKLDVEHQYFHRGSDGVERPISKPVNEDNFEQLPGSFDRDRQTFYPTNLSPADERQWRSNEEGDDWGSQEGEQEAREEEEEEEEEEDYPMNYPQERNHDISKEFDDDYGYDERINDLTASSRDWNLVMEPTSTAAF